MREITHANDFIGCIRYWEHCSVALVDSDIGNKQRYMNNMQPTFGAFLPILPCYMDCHDRRAVVLARIYCTAFWRQVNRSEVGVDTFPKYKPSLHHASSV